MIGVGRPGRLGAAVGGCFVLALGAASVISPSAWAVTTSRYSVPILCLPFMKAPPITGPMRPEQWAGADAMVGFCANNPGPNLMPQPARFWVGGDTRHLFVAVVSDTPPGDKVIARAVPVAGGNARGVYKDDAVEIWVDPSPDNARGLIYQTLINAKAATEQYTYGKGGANPGAWRGRWRVSSKIADNRWLLEAAIPWSDFGLKNVEGKQIGVRICRDWQQIPKGGSSSGWSPLGGAYENSATMPCVTFSAAAPVVQLLQLQDGPNEPASLRLSIRNPYPTSLRVRVSMRVAPQSSMPVARNEVLTLAPHSTKIIQMHAPSEPHEWLNTCVLVSSANRKTVFYRRDFRWQTSRPVQLWLLHKQAAKRYTKFMYFPSLNVMQVRVNLSGLADAAHVRAVRLQVRNRKTGRTVAATIMPPLVGGVTRLGEWRIPPLDGKYDLVARFGGIHAAPEILPFVRYHFPWEHNRLGKANIIAPPFTPIRVQGDIVSVIGRRQAMNGLGLWDQVWALDKPLLSGPIRLVVRAGGHRYLGHGRLRFVEVKPTRVVTVAHWSAGPLTGSTRSVWDYDGAMKSTLTLAPTTRRLDSVALVIPLHDRRARLFHACTDDLRVNYAGQAPSGLGEIWKSSEAPHRDIIGSYVPYIWLGGTRRGLAVFGDNDRGWVDYQAKTPCQELVRQANGTLQLRFNVVAKPVQLTAPHPIVLGFQATPIKPMPRGWRRWTLEHYVRGCYNIMIDGSGYGYGALSGGNDFYPRRHDYSIYRELARTRQTRKVPWDFIKKWLAGYPPDPLNPNDVKNWGVSVRSFFSQMTYQPQVVGVYTNPSGMRLDTREARTYLDEWSRRAYPTRQHYFGESVDYGATPCKSYRDMALWYYNKMLTTFCDSIYWDDMFLKSVFHTVGADGYRLPNGQLQPGGQLWAERALVRRTAILDAQLHKPNRNIVHMTNTAIAPILAFARLDLDLEMKENLADFQDRFSRAFLQTESIGRQFGNVPLVLAHIEGGTHDRRVWVRRTYAGVCLTFELKPWFPYTPAYWHNFRRMIQFGYGTPHVRVWNYWDHGYPLKVLGVPTSSVLLSKPGQALIVVCDWHHGGVARLRLLRQPLRLPSQLKARDLETNKAVKVASGMILLPLKKNDFRVLLVH